MINKSELIKQLLDSSCLKYGQFTLKSGASSSYYVDLREATMHQELFRSIVKSVASVIRSTRDSEASLNKKTAIVGVPYGVVPLAASVAYDMGLVYYPVRKEVKEYGSKIDASSYNELEYILVEDVMSTGSSIVETIKKLEGKRITDIIVVVNRESGGDENLASQYPDIRLHSIIRASELSANDNK